MRDETSSPVSPTGRTSPSPSGTGSDASSCLALPYRSCISSGRQPKVSCTHGANPIATVGVFLMFLGASFCQPKSFTNQKSSRLLLFCLQRLIFHSQDLKSLLLVRNLSVSLILRLIVYGVTEWRRILYPYCATGLRVPRKFWEEGFRATQGLFLVRTLRRMRGSGGILCSYFL